MHTTKLQQKESVLCGKKQCGRWKDEHLESKSPFIQEFVNIM